MSTSRLLIGVEGLPCAGKTTLCRKIERRLSFGFVPEMAEFLASHERFPPDARTRFEVYQVANWFVTKELARYELAREKRMFAPVVMDRTFLTIMTYNFAYQKFTGITSHKKLNLAVKNHIRSGRFLRPDLLIYLYIAPATLRARRATRIYIPPESLPEFWVDDNFLGPLVEAYDTYIQCLNIPVLRIDGTLEEELVYEMAKAGIIEYAHSQGHPCKDQ